jgi:hypothetical protein
MKIFNIVLSIAVLCAFSSAFGCDNEAYEYSSQPECETDCSKNPSFTCIPPYTPFPSSDPCWYCELNAGASKSSDTHSHMTALKTT